MILSAHQPVYLPWLGLFHKIAVADQFIIFDQVPFEHYGWSNRNKVKTPAGSVWLTVPVLHRNHQRKRLADLEIHNRAPWPRKHWETLRLRYGKAPYFNTYAPFFEDTYHREWARLVEINDYMLRWFLDTLGIRTPVRSAGEFEFRGNKDELVLHMAVALGADVFVFGALGRDYADVQAFRRAGVEPVFQEYRHPVYPQLHGDFVSHLSIVDLLFNCGPASLEILMSGNVTKGEIGRSAGSKRRNGQ